MGALGFLTGLGLLGGAAASKIAEPRNSVNLNKSRVLDKNWLLNDIMYNKLRLFYNTKEDCTNLAWERYYMCDTDNKDVKPLELSITERYAASYFGYNLEQIYYDLYRQFKSQQKAFNILREIMTKYWCKKVDLEVKSGTISDQFLNELYDKYMNSSDFLDPYGQKVVKVGAEIDKNRYKWGNKQAERYIIKSFPECFEGNERPKPSWRPDERPTRAELAKWLPEKSAENLNRLKNEIEMIYGSTLQDMVHYKWMHGDMYIAPGGDPNRARRPGNELFCYCSSPCYGNSEELGLHVSGFDFPPANDYEKKVYEDFKMLYD